MTVVGERIVRELNGVSCLPLELMLPAKKGITVSRSFGALISPAPLAAGRFFLCVVQMDARGAMDSVPEFLYA